MDPNAKPGKYKEILLSIDEENNKCVDCGKENPTKVSVNNGIIICEECAEKHTQLGTMISYIRDINDEFDEYLLNFFTLGGNSKFEKFLKEENVDTTLPIEQKYKTKAVDFYRKNLKHKVQGEVLIEKNYENPNEILEHSENYFPEFENYQIKKEPPKTKVQQAKSVAGKIGSGLFSFGKKMYSGMKTGATYAGKKSLEGAKFVGHKASQGASYVATKAQPALKKGATFVGHQVEGVYSNLKNKMTHKEKKEEKKEEGEKKEGEENKGEENKGEENKEENKGEENKGEENKGEENKGDENKEKGEEKIDDIPNVGGELINQPGVNPENNQGQA